MKNVKTDYSNSSEPASIVLGLYALAFIGLHIWGAIDPAHQNWGFQSFGFYPSSTGITFLLLGLTLLYPGTQSLIVRLVSRLAEAGSKLPWPILFVGLGGAALGASMLFPVTSYLLGDGAILLRSIPSMKWNEIPTSFRNQPLMAFVYRGTDLATNAVSRATPAQVYFVIDIIGALLLILLLIYVFRKLRLASADASLYGALLLSAGGTVFFFGYVENYVIQYVITAAYALLGWLALEKRISVIPSILCFVLMIGLNLGNLIFVPTLGLLFLQNWNRKKLLGAALALSLAGFLFLALYLMNFSVVTSMEKVISQNRNFLPLFTREVGFFPYAMFSWAHALDWFNSVILVAPFGLVIPIISIAFFRKEIEWKNPAFLFLAGLTASGLAFTWTVNTALGMARDWDLLASFYMPLLVLGVYLLYRNPAEGWKRNSLVVMAGLTMIQTGARVGINSNPERHLLRAEILNSPVFLSASARLFYYESMANYFYGTRDFPKAKKYYELYMPIDSTNTRILANLSDIYRKTGLKEEYFAILKRTANLKSPNPGVYSNLGVEYALRGDTARALEYNKKAVEMDSTQKQAQANLGILFMSRKEYEPAAFHFLQALRYGMNEPIAYRGAADALSMVGRYGEALRLYDRYLEKVPGDARTREVRRRVEEMLKGTGRK